MKKLPKGISNYEELIQDGYYYVDKTKYIEKLENLDDKRRYNNSVKLGKTRIAPETLIKSQTCKNKNTEDCIDRRKMNVRT